MVLVLYKKRNKGVIGVQDAEGKTWHTKGPHEDRDAMQESKPSPMKKEAAGGEKKTP
jgi:hypothetical protein